MHEMGIAQGILDVVRDYVPEGREADVREVRVRVGKLAGVVIDSLEFCFSALAGASPFTNARMAVLEIPVRLSCESCGKESQSEGLTFHCPACSGTSTRLISGRELEVVEIDLAEEATQTS